jgi:hypothetical protein
MVDIPFDEFANDPDEVHAIMHGIYRGFSRVDPRKIPTDIKDVRGETHYYKFGFLIGWLVKIGLVLWLGPSLVSM